MLAVARCHRLVITAILICGLNGCATRPPASDPEALAEYNETNDPLEPANRVFYTINNGIDTVVLKPAAQAYRYVVPERVRPRRSQRALQSRYASRAEQRHDARQAAPRRRHHDALPHQHDRRGGGGLRFRQELGLPRPRHGFRRDPGAVELPPRVPSCSCRCWGPATRGMRWASA